MPITQEQIELAGIESDRGWHPGWVAGMSHSQLHRYLQAIGPEILRERRSR